jgi:undecaprenyl phosphate N,N'-diacetylbacillosamine 1-phosphate transferase
MKYTYFKRFFDVFFAVCALLILSPVLLICILCILITSKGPVFFLQERAGRNGKPFKILKLRTMTHKKRDVNKEIFKGNAEVTVVGKILRRLKIDELPQLINILKGDMSFIGPRPAMTNLQDKFDENGVYRLHVRPGLSGLAQVHGNIYLDWPERWQYDRRYVTNMSFVLDLEIIMKTFLVVFFGEKKFLKKNKKEIS